MSNVIIDDANLYDIADAIREKSESTDTFLAKLIFGKCTYGEMEDLETDCLKFIHAYIASVQSCFPTGYLALGDSAIMIQETSS